MKPPQEHQVRIVPARLRERFSGHIVVRVDGCLLEIWDGISELPEGRLPYDFDLISIHPKDYRMQNHFAFYDFDEGSQVVHTAWRGHVIPSFQSLRALVAWFRWVNGSRHIRPFS